VEGLSGTSRVLVPFLAIVAARHFKCPRSQRNGSISEVASHAPHGMMACWMFCTRGTESGSRRGSPGTNRLLPLETAGVTRAKVVVPKV